MPDDDGAGGMMAMLMGMMWRAARAAGTVINNQMQTASMMPDAGGRGPITGGREKNNDEDI